MQKLNCMILWCKKGPTSFLQKRKKKKRKKKKQKWKINRKGYLKHSLRHKRNIFYLKKSSISISCYYYFSRRNYSLFKILYIKAMKLNNKQYQYLSDFMFTSIKY